MRVKLSAGVGRQEAERGHVDVSSPLDVLGGVQDLNSKLVMSLLVQEPGCPNEEGLSSQMKSLD